jgi:electron-transferring-flavoprotein dehydrogenase
MPGGQLSLGFVVGLDYKDPLFDPHMAFNRFKQHPLISALLAGGQMIRYGAKALPEGGWNTIPRPFMDGGLIAGDAGGFLNSMRLKGIHLAMRTGMLAAESAFGALCSGERHFQLGLDQVAGIERPCRVKEPRTPSQHQHHNSK